ncbi:methyltransferase domain protein [Mycobacterium xenopi 4042]|uniref:Methyltransferase domain protein n=1 Tax=Mycobacterium xenopi 4042 TaxID=1299334 RepID=X7YR33_MYCXE|nr:methyltransferase domain protein [Mycobacterium xenopi 4042]
MGLSAADEPAVGPGVSRRRPADRWRRSIGRAATFPPTMAATESWPPNAALATRRLHPRGVVVVATRDEPPLPFADEAFDLVTSRHPIAVWWTEIARVLRPGGTYLAQHIGPASVRELVEFFRGPSQRPRATRTTGTPRPKRPACRSSTCAWNACGWSSSTSVRSSTFCAR